MPSAVLPCGHVAFPQHRSGGRLVRCPSCGEWASVTAKEVPTMVYEVAEARPPWPDSQPDKGYGEEGSDAFAP